MGLSPKLEELSMSTQWRASPELRERRASKLRMVLPALAICVLLGVFCFATGRFIAGLWLITAFLSWAFLFGAANASEQASDAIENDEMSQQRGWTGADCEKKPCLNIGARKSPPAPAPSKRGSASRSQQGSGRLP